MWMGSGIGRGIGRKDKSMLLDNIIYMSIYLNMNNSFRGDKFVIGTFSILISTVAE